MVVWRPPHDPDPHLTMGDLGGPILDVWSPGSPVPVAPAPRRPRVRVPTGSCHRLAVARHENCSCRSKGESDHEEPNIEPALHRIRIRVEWRLGICCYRGIQRIVKNSHRIAWSTTVAEMVTNSHGVGHSVHIGERRFDGGPTTRISPTCVVMEG